MKRCRDQGFTLVEVLIALALMALIAVIVLPQFTYPPMRQMNSAIQSVQNDLHRLRIEAMTSGAAVVYAPPRGFEDQIHPVQMSVEGDIGTAGIRFLPDGSSSGGTIILRHGDDMRRLSLDWATGSAFSQMTANEEP